MNDDILRQGETRQKRTDRILCVLDFVCWMLRCESEATDNGFAGY